MSDSEINSINKSLDIFVEGLQLLDYKKISEVFHEKAISPGVSKDEIKSVYRDHWKELAEQLKAEGKPLESAQGYYKIRSLNIVRNAASVIIDLAFGDENKITERYIDFYHMLKVDEKWVN
jgi:hypothetical protein